MINFRETFKDSVDVTKVSAFCFGNSSEITPLQLMFHGGGSKFSSLCGFKFDSKTLPKYGHGEFMIVFCAKLRSKIYHDAGRNPSQWFAWLRINKEHAVVLDKETCLKAFNFNIDKFFDSDLFQKYSKKFQETCTKGLSFAEKTVKKYADKHGYIPGTTIEFAWLPRYVEAIKEAIPLITSTTFMDKRYNLRKYTDKPKLGKEKTDKQVKDISKKFNRFDRG
jgi:hypothetical protein